MSLNPKSLVMSLRNMLSSQMFFKKLLRMTLVVLVISGIGLLGYFNRDKLVVARVGNRFITRHALNNVLVQRYGATALSQLVDTAIIEQALAKEGVQVSNEEVIARIKELNDQIKASVGMDLKEYLESQHLSLSRVEKDIRNQLALEKLLSDSVTVTDEEVKSFVEENGSYLPGDDDTAKQESARKLLRDRKFGEAAQNWLESKRAEYPVSIYLK